MPTNIEQAVLELLLSGHPLTLTGVFASFMRVSAFQTSSPAAIASFERALEKHSAQPDLRCSAIIMDLRNEYWYLKRERDIAEDQKTSRACDHCGHGIQPPTASGNTTPEESGDDVNAHMRPRQRTRGRRANRSTNCVPSAQLVSANN